MSGHRTARAGDATLEGRAGSRRDPLLMVRNLHVSYGRAVRALDDITLDVGEGSVVAVLGNNGAGKSTLLRSISGTLPMHGGTIIDGSISFQGSPLHDLDPSSIVRAGVVQVPEGRRIFGELTVEENLRVAALASDNRKTRASARDRVYDLFPRLSERRAQPGSLLSGGEQQMLAIGRALMTSPKLLLLDEPSLGLAPNLVAHTAQVIKEINDQGTPVLVVEQDAAMALELADWAYVLEVGEVSLEGPAGDLIDSAEIHDSYLGGSATVRDASAGAAVGMESKESDPVRIENLSVRFGGVTALSDVSFVVEPGTTHALIGPNGAGKSTLINVLTGVYRATNGSVFYGRHELTRMRSHQIRDIGISRTFQNIALSPEASVADNLMLGRYSSTRTGFISAGFRLPKAVKERRQQLSQTRDVAALVGLEKHLEAKAGSLPYGLQKLVELGRAISTRPRVLVLDEPVAGMNAGEAAEMAAILSEVQNALGITILIVEHNMPFVMSLADRVTVLDFGRRIADGSPSDIRSDPDVIQAYLGGSEDKDIREALERQGEAP
jgi:ABC-type branched-subunit amino acid transport system ATPase component